MLGVNFRTARRRGFPFAMLEVLTYINLVDSALNQGNQGGKDSFAIPDRDFSWEGVSASRLD